MDYMVYMWCTWKLIVSSLFYFVSVKLHTILNFYNHVFIMFGYYGYLKSQYICASIST
jgi:hypothetical protein